MMLKNFFWRSFLSQKKAKPPDTGGKLWQTTWKTWASSLNTAELCRLQLKSLKEKYERNKKKSKQSGESPPESDCEDLEDIFDKCPDMKPVVVTETRESDTSSKDSTPSTSSETAAKERSKEDPVCGMYINFQQVILTFITLKKMYEIIITTLDVCLWNILIFVIVWHMLIYNSNTWLKVTLTFKWQAMHNYEIWN